MGQPASDFLGQPNTFLAQACDGAQGQGGERRAGGDARDPGAGQVC
jgi:hypothetical protein